MTRNEIKNVIDHINEKQVEINRHESRLDRVYNTEPFDTAAADHAERLESLLHDEYIFRNGMVWALCCAAYKYGRPVQSISTEKTGGGLWYFEER